MFLRGRRHERAGCGARCRSTRPRLDGLAGDAARRHAAAARVHPDKLLGCADAKEAFQALVRAYELCCKPEQRADDSEDSRESDA